MEFFSFLRVVCLCAVFTGTVAESKGHNMGAWLMAGLLFGPLALLASLGLADLKTRRYLRLLAEHHGVVVEPQPIGTQMGAEEADEQRKRILGLK